jgi:outer membrane protein TolC
MASLLYDDYYVAARALEVNAEHIALLESFQKIATARYEAGAAAQQDPIQAEVELSHALHDKILLGTALRVVAEQINALLHRASTAPLPAPPARAASPGAAPDLPADLIAQALDARPELAAAQARIAAEQARVDLARREYFPDFTLSGGYDRFWDERELRPSVGLAMNVPLQLGRRSAALDEAEARLEQAYSERAALEDEVRLDAERGAERYAEAHQVLRLIADRQLPASRDQVEAARAGFETGRNSFLALIDAERNLRNVELDYEQALADVSRRRAELDRALGRIPGIAW